MSEKVTIPADVADLIGNMRKVGCTNEEIARVAMGNTSIPLYHEVLSQIPFDTLLAALVNGYEREQTEEERAHAAILKEYRSAWIDAGDGDEHANGFTDGVEFALNTLGVKIGGVNA